MDALDADCVRWSGGAPGRDHDWSLAGLASFGLVSRVNLLVLTTVDVAAACDLVFTAFESGYRNELGWTLLFASFLTIMGLFRLIAAISLKFPHWGWAVFDGIVTLGLGILLWADWPWSGLWFLGLSVGISLVLRGWSYVMFAISIRNLPVSVDVRLAA